MIAVLIKHTLRSKRQVVVASVTWPVDVLMVARHDDLVLLLDRNMLTAAGMVQGLELHVLVVHFRFHCRYPHDLAESLSVVHSRRLEAGL